MPTRTERVLASLNQVPLFEGLRRGQLERLAKQFVERKYDEGETIVEQGQGGEGFFIITSGHTEVIRERLDGTKAKVNEFGPTDFFGEMALLDTGPRTASVITTEPTECLALTRWNFLAVLKEDPDTAIAILQAMAKRFRMALDVL